MEFSLVRYNKKTSSVEHLRASLAAALKNRKVSSVSIDENSYSGEVLIKILSSKSAGYSHLIKVTDVCDLTDVADDIDAYVKELSSDSIEAINLIPLGGGRAVGFVISVAPTLSDGDKPKRRTRTKKAQAL